MSSSLCEADPITVLKEADRARSTPSFAANARVMPVGLPTGCRRLSDHIKCLEQRPSGSHSCSDSSARGVLPVKYEGNPVLQADQPWEQNMSIRSYDSLIYDEDQKLY